MSSEVVERLAARMFQEAEHLDPSSDGDGDAEDCGWSKLTERKREFWRLIVSDQLAELGELFDEMIQLAQADWTANDWRQKIEELLTE